MTAWLKRRAENSLKPGTSDNYQGVTRRYILPTIGRIKLEKLTTDDVRKVHDYVTKTKHLSSTTALNAHRVLAKALTDAMREGRVGRNVATLIEAPSKAVGTRGALTAEQAQALLLSVADSPLDAARWSVALLTGLRQGERLGMTEEFVDLDRDIITVAWQLQRLTWKHGCGDAVDKAWSCGRRRGGDCPQRQMIIPPDHEVKQVYGGLWMLRPKSRAGWREVPIARPLHAVLERYLSMTDRGDEGLIFHRGDGRPIDPSPDSEAWDAALRNAAYWSDQDGKRVQPPADPQNPPAGWTHVELPDVPLHAARHTTATLLHALGVPDLTRIAILGHSSATVTAGYTHVSGPEMIDAMGRLGGLLTAP